MAAPINITNADFGGVGGEMKIITLEDLRKVFTLDIETQPNEKLIKIFIDKIKAPKTYKDPEKIAAYIEEKKLEMVKTMSVDVDFCEIKCIGLKEDDQPAKIVTLEELVALLNECLLPKAEAGSEFSSRHFFKIITFNGKKFDWPVIIRECIRRGIKDAPIKEMHRWCKKFDSQVHVDLWEVIGDGQGKSLDMYSQIYLDWPKKECNFETCTMEELEEHCVDDVDMTYTLYKVFDKLI